jgi:hypothetical protein
MEDSNLAGTNISGILADSIFMAKVGYSERPVPIYENSQKILLFWNNKDGH